MTIRGQTDRGDLADTIIEVAVEELRSQFDAEKENPNPAGTQEPRTMTRRKAEKLIVFAVLRKGLRGLTGWRRDADNQPTAAVYSHENAAKIVVERAILTFLRLSGGKIPGPQGLDSADGRPAAERLLAQRAVAYLVPGPFRTRRDLSALRGDLTVGFDFGNSPGITLDNLITR